MAMAQTAQGFGGLPALRQIGLMIFSSDRDYTLRPHPGTTLTIQLDSTHIKLPIVGGDQAYARAFQEDSDQDDTGDSDSE